MKLEVKSAEVETKAGTSQRSGKPYSIRLQRGWFHLDGQYPQLVEFRLGNEQPALTPGFYAVGPHCIEVDRNRHPVFDLAKSTPAK